MNKVTPVQEQELSVYHLIKSNRSNQHPDNKKQATKPEQEIICKICLEGYEDGHSMEAGSLEESQLIVPCECSGSVGFVHQKCIKLWVQRQLLNNNSKRAYCQICKEQIFFKICKLRTFSCQQQKKCHESLCNIVCLVVQVVLLALVGIFYHFLDNITTVQLVRYFTVAMIIVLSMTLALTSYLIFKENFIKTTKIIQKIYSVRECEQIGYKQVKYPQIVVNAEEFLQRLKIMKKNKKDAFKSRLQVNGTPRRFSSIEPAQNNDLQRCR